MLKKYNSTHGTRFQMGLKYENNVNVVFDDVFKYIKNLQATNKLIFIDPIVLAYHQEFLNLENNENNVILVPTNMHEANKQWDSVVSILQIMEKNNSIQF